eukprot:6456083-Amphidinium_carterae.2
MPEFLGFVRLSCGAAPTLTAKRRTTIDLPYLPRGSKLISYYKGVGEVVKVGTVCSATDVCEHCGRVCAEGGDGSCTARWMEYGVFRTPQEFHTEACLKPFPMEHAGLAKPWQVTALRTMLRRSPYEVSILRSRALTWMTRMAKYFEGEEAVIHNEMPDHVRRIMAGKRVRMFEELLVLCGYESKYLSKGLRRGFDLTGIVARSPMFPGRMDVTVPVNREELLKSAETAVQRAIDAMRPLDPESEQDLMSVTAKEVENGWLKGPMTKSEVDELHGVGNWIAARRFGIWQSSGDTKTKMRQIDDFTASGQNAAAASEEKLDHGGIDEILGLAKTLQVASITGRLIVKDVYGNATEEDVNPAWKGQRVCLRAVDLKSAYKQLAVSLKDLPLALVGFWANDRKEPLFWQSLALPFGALASVYGFNEASRGIEVIMNVIGTVVA